MKEMKHWMLVTILTICSLGTVFTSCTDDAGITPTYELETADFFNVSKVTQLIEQFYAK